VITRNAVQKCYCANPQTTECYQEWNLAYDDTATCNRYWSTTFGPYYKGMEGDDTSVLVKATSGARIGVDNGNERYPDYQAVCQSVCPTMSCKEDISGNIIFFNNKNKKCGQYVVCE